MTKWQKKVQALIKFLGGGDKEKESYLQANAETVERTAAGFGPDDTEAGAMRARMVVNIPAVHIPAFCEASENGDKKPYKNGYDLVRVRVGDSSDRRVLVDEALPINFSPSDLYFGAVAISGSGIRFYGDICLVLKRDALAHDTVILDRNSYDLIRPPLQNRIGNDAQKMQQEAEAISGQWHEDLGQIATVKVFQRHTATAYRLTTGQIADAILEDENYIEVLKEGSFSTKNLLEARTSAADATLRERLERRLRHGPTLNNNELLWLERRRKAEKALRDKGVDLHVVTTSGRTK